MRPNHLLPASILVLCSLCGCLNVSHEATSSASATVSPPAGSQVKIHFNRSALGLAGNATPIDADVLNGSELSVRGEFVALNDAWVVLKAQAGDERWIPREAILQIKVEPK